LQEANDTWNVTVTQIKCEMETRSKKDKIQGTILQHMTAGSNTTRTHTKQRTKDNNVTHSGSTHDTTPLDSRTMAANTNTVTDGGGESSVSNSDLMNIMLRMEAAIADLRGELQTLSKKVQNNETDISEMKAAITYNGDAIADTINNVVPELNRKRTSLAEHIDTELLRRDLHDKRQNLIFHGIDQVTDETGAEIKYRLRRVLVSDFGLTEKQSNDCYLVDLHRIHRKREDARPMRDKRPEPVVVRFGAVADRDAILEQQQKRPFFRERKPVMAYPDLPKKMNQERGRLLQEAKKQRALGKLTRIRIVGINVRLETKDRSRGSQWRTFTLENKKPAVEKPLAVEEEPEEDSTSEEEGSEEEPGRDTLSKEGGD